MAFNTRSRHCLLLHVVINRNVNADNPAIRSGDLQRLNIVKVKVCPFGNS